VKLPTASSGRRRTAAPLPQGGGAAPAVLRPASPAEPRQPSPPALPAAPPEAATPPGIAEVAHPPESPVEDPWAAPWATAAAAAPAPAEAVAAERTRPPRRPFRWPWRRARSAEAAVARLRARPEPPPPEPLPTEPPQAEAALPESAAPRPVPPPAPPLPSLPLAGLPPLPLPLRALVEGFGALLLLALVDRLVTGGTGFSHWPASPFVLPVLYVAARYGMLPGVLVAAAAGVLRLGLAVTAGAWTTGAWVLPLIWPLVAAAIGALTDLRRRRLAAAEAAAAAAAEDRAAIAEANQRLAERMLELEGRLNARLQAGTAIFQAARIMGQGTEGVIRGATGLLRAATGCTACSFWLAEDRTLQLVAAEGWPQGAPLSHTLLPGPLTDAIRQGRGALVATRLADRLALGEEGVLAAPVLSPWDGMLLGMVKIEDIGFQEFGLDTIAALEAAAGWIGGALAEARAREASESAGGIAGLQGPATAGGLMVPGEEAGRAITVMTGLARRLGFDLALLSAEIPAGPRAAAALEATRAAMAEAFRGSDLLLEARMEDRRLSILLPGTAVAGAEIAAARLRDLLAARAPAATAQVVVGVALLHGLRGGGWQSAGLHGR
jgi:hypothetical protein